jgi:hypothetical protein
VGFVTVAALASLWQAHTAKLEIEATEEDLVRNEKALKEKQEEIRRFKRARERRAAVLAALGLAALIYLQLV